MSPRPRVLLAIAILVCGLFAPVSVSALGDPPQCVDGIDSTNEDIPLDGSVASLCSDTEGDTLSYAKLSDPADGSVALSAIGNYTYTPNANFNGTDSFTFRADDGTSNSDPTTVTITVNAVNDPPTCSADTASGNQDTDIHGSVACSDPDGDPLTYSVVDNGTHGTAAFGTGPSYTYTPTANYHGSDSFTFKTSDGALDSNTATASITVNAVNHPPSAGSNSYSIGEDGHLAVPAPGVLGNDSDPDGDTLTAGLVSGPAHGGLSLNSNGSFSYDPDANFHGADSFTYRANDGALNSSPATVSITVNAVNDAPTCSPDSTSGSEDTVIGGSVACTDPDGDPLTYSVVADGAHGTAAFGVGSSYTYTPDSNYHGPDSFTFKANDGNLDSNTATASVTVNSVNDPPTCSAGSISTPEDSAATDTVSCTDLDGDTLSYVKVASPSHGTVSFTGSTSSFTYTPDPNYHGTDSFTFRAGDGTSNSNIATVSITVTAVNDPPTCSADTTSGNEDTVISGSVACTDPDGDPLTYSIVADGAHGTAAFGTGPSYSYTPDANYHGPDTFTFRANDGNLDSNTAAATVTVNPVNDPPTCSPGSASTPEDTAVVLALTCSDIDGDLLTVYAVDALPTHGGAVQGLLNSVTYTPNANYHGPDSLTFTVSDGQFVSVPATFAITVDSVNDAPVCTPQTIDVRKNTPKNGTVTCADVDGDVLTYTQASSPGHGSIDSFSSSGALHYIPNPNYIGPDSFLIEASDGVAIPVPGTVTLDVRPDPYARTDGPLSDPPVPSITQGSGPVAIDVLANDVDLDPGDVIKVTAITSAPSHGKVVITGGGTGVTYDPTGFYAGPDDFQYEITDLDNGKSRAFVTLTIARAKPKVSAPVVTFPAGRAMGTSTVPVRVAWSLLDDGTGARSYALQERLNSHSYVSVRLASSRSRSTTRSLGLGSSWTYRSRLADTAGNTGAWATGHVFRIARYQESSVTFSGAWGTSSSSSFSGGKARYSGTAGASATLAFTGSAIGYVSSKGSTRGSVRVFIDGVFAGTVSLRSSSTVSRSIVFSRSFGSVGNHVIRLEVAGTAGHPRVDVDAFLVIR